jgi:hypothetical protein
MVTAASSARHLVIDVGARRLVAHGAPWITREDLTTQLRPRTLVAARRRRGAGALVLPLVECAKPPVRKRRTSRLPTGVRRSPWHIRAI